MSATGRSDVRHPDDFYSTPGWCVRALLPYLAITPSAFTLDPCAGDGAILRVLGTGIGLELSHERFAKGVDVGVARRDALSPEPWPPHCQVITNPPYGLALDFVERSIAETLRASGQGEIAMLLRLNWLSSQKRSGFHRAHPSDVYVLPSRPEFAASLKCKKKCGFAVMQPLGERRPKLCPSCGLSGVTCTTTDATEYAWFVWGPGRGNRWWLL